LVVPFADVVKSRLARRVGAGFLSTGDTTITY
jgi:hypothetical protein